MSLFEHCFSTYIYIICILLEYWKIVFEFSCCSRKLQRSCTVISLLIFCFIIKNNKLLLHINNYLIFRMCDRVLGSSKELWEEEVYRFAKHHKLKVVKFKVSCIFVFIKQINANNALSEIMLLRLHKPKQVIQFIVYVVIQFTCFFFTFLSLIST